MRRGSQPQPRTAVEPPAVPGARWVPLTQGRFALVDEADYPRVSPFNWIFAPHGYAYRMRPRVEGQARGGLLLHRFILDAPAGVQVDHRSGDRLDCRRANLRYATASQNGANSRAKGRGRFKGVYRSKDGKPWRAAIMVNRRYRSLGQFNTPEEAALAYNVAAAEAFGEYAKLNDLTQREGVEGGRA